MAKCKFADAFKEEREKSGIGKMDDQGDPVVMLLNHKDVRKAAHNYKAFSSEAVPGRIVVPSEVNIRTTRQIPFEVDPPMHKVYRSLLEAWFKRPLQDTYKEKLTTIIGTVLDDVLSKDKVDVVSDLALVIQSRALTLLLNVPFDKSVKWISWGTHVFRSEGEALDGDKAAILYNYIDEEIDNAIANPTDNLYSTLLAAEVNGKKLTKEEVKGVLILTFAGGRDTVINALTNMISYFSANKKALDYIRSKPEIIKTAVEEFIRYFSPLTHMGRVVTEDTTVCEHAVKADSRISLCWASANRDEKVFENPDEVILERKVNPHVGFGFSHHNCLGATHARQIMRITLKLLAEKVSDITVLEAEENIENLGEFTRKVGYNSLKATFKKS